MDDRAGERAIGPGAGDPLIGRTLDRYRVLEKLGEGGMGAVYAVEHVLLRKRMAMKLLRADLCEDAEQAARFHNEAIAAGRIGHENIVDVTDFGWTGDGQAYLVMEELRGRSLAQALHAEGPLSPSRALKIAWQVARALEAAHAAGIIHRDLKPDNIMLVPRDGVEIVKVLDFGVSKVAAGPQGLTRLGLILGTPEYMSPEQSGGRPVDHRSDIYAFGVLLHEMLEGRPPFTDVNPVQVLLKHQSAPVPELRTARLPAALRALIRQSLAKHPDDRPPTMSDCLSRLTEVARQLRATPLPAQKAEPRPGASKSAPRLRLLPARRPPPVLTPQQAFVASRLTGCALTPSQLVQVSGLPRAAALTIIQQLLAERVIDVA
ncbi:MAG TPA: serine/threonine-protein kinase [Myxococcales bacterium]|nr:serine/threonine-protein kinase [Myxococcales bacterium]